MRYLLELLYVVSFRYGGPILSMVLPGVGLLVGAAYCLGWLPQWWAKWFSVGSLLIGAGVWAWALWIVSRGD